jgi:hypothetical protein
MALLHKGAMHPIEPANAPRSSLFSQRARRQLGLFFAGAGFFAFSTLITRRALVRRYQASIPKFYQPSNRPSFQVNGALEAFEALNIATINVLSLGMMTAGGLLYAFDISSLDDMKRIVRRRLGVDGNKMDQEAEEEVEELFGSILGRNLKKEKHRKETKENEEKS